MTTETDEIEADDHTNKYQKMYRYNFDWGHSFMGCVLGSLDLMENNNAVFQPEKYNDRKRIM